MEVWKERAVAHLTIFSHTACILDPGILSDDGQQARCVVTLKLLCSASMGCWGSEHALVLEASSIILVFNSNCNPKKLHIQLSVCLALISHAIFMRGNHHACMHVFEDDPHPSQLLLGTYSNTG